MFTLTWKCLQTNKNYTVLQTTAENRCKRASTPSGQRHRYRWSQQVVTLYEFLLINLAGRLTERFMISDP